MTIHASAFVLAASEAFAAALRQLRSFPVRSGIAMLSVGLGVAGIVAVASLSEGLQKTVVSSFESLGRQVVIVRADPSYESLVLGTATRLSNEDVRAIARIFPDSDVAPFLRYGGFDNPIALGEQKTTSALYGTSISYFELGEVELVAGRSPRPVDWKAQGRECLVGRTVANKLGGSQSLIGSNLVIGGRSCRVVGVVKGAGSALGFDFEKLVISSIDFVRAIDSAAAFSDLEIHIGFSDAVNIEMISRRLTDELRKSRRISRGENDFIIVTAQGLRRYLDGTLQAIRTGLFALMAVVFAVAALGIGNVMLSGVAMRRREIAIKRAIGASRTEIFFEFLLEAVILTGFGGLFGIGLGAIAAWAITTTSRYFGAPTVSIGGCIVSMAVALAVGLATGVLPAMRAARLDPIAGLHHH